MGFIRDVRARPEDSTLLSAIVHARDEVAKPLSDTELVNNLRLLFLVGHETSASTMAWMVSELARAPQSVGPAEQRGRERGGDPHVPQELKKFPYAEAVFRETLRLYPVVSTDTRAARAGPDRVVVLGSDGRRLRDRRHPQRFTPERPDHARAVRRPPT